MIRERSYWLAALPALSGLLFGLSFPPLDWHWLAWIALVPMAWCWTQPCLPRSAYWAAYLGGVAAHLLALSWLRTSYCYGGRWFGPYADAWLAISLLCGVFFVGMFAYGGWLARRTPLPMTLLLPVVWVSYELVHQYGAVLIDQTGFPWCKLALTQVGGGYFLQTADLGGASLISFLIAMVNGTVVDMMLVLSVRTGLLHRSGHAMRMPRIAGPFVAAVLLMLLAVYGRWRVAGEETEPGPVACLMGELDLPPLLDRQRIAAAVRQAQGTWPDLLLWPELAWHHKLFDAGTRLTLASLPAIPPDVAAVIGPRLKTYPGYVRQSLVGSANEFDATLLIGCERLSLGKHCWQRFNSIACTRRQLGFQQPVIECYDKRYPVPWAEFLPYSGGGESTGYQHGAGQATFRIRSRENGRTYRCRPSICYDLCFASHFWNHATAGQTSGSPDFIFHCGAEGQDRTGALSEVMLRMARLRAVETRRAIVRNVSQGTSGIIDGNGEVRIAAAEHAIENPIWIGPIPIDQRTSFYARFGDWPMIFICVLSTLVGVSMDRKIRVLEESSSR